MKFVLALVLLFPLAAFSQDCQLRKEVDQFSQKPKLTTGFIQLGSGQVSLSIDVTATDIDFLFTFSNKDNPRCFDDLSTASFSFDSTRSKGNFRNSGTLNCEGVFHMSFRNSTTIPSGLNRLATTKTASIKFTGTGKNVFEITLTPQEKEQLMKWVSCIAAEAKTLIK
jgi:hypothetical protein